MSLRIIAGERRGAILAAPRGDNTRPTLARVRESLFMVLDPWIAGARVLDAFAGSGALGLEALSRGASHAVFFENHREALAALRQNLAKLRYEDRAKVDPRDATKIFRKPHTGEPFDLLLLDPPYHRDLAAHALEAMADHAPQWLAPEGRLVAQVGRDDAMPESIGTFRCARILEYNLTKVFLYERTE